MVGPYDLCLRTLMVPLRMPQRPPRAHLAAAAGWAKGHVGHPFPYPPFTTSSPSSLSLLVSPAVAMPEATTKGEGSAKPQRRRVAERRHTRPCSQPLPRTLLPLLPAAKASPVFRRYASVLLESIRRCPPTSPSTTPAPPLPFCSPSLFYLPPKPSQQPPPPITTISHSAPPPATPTRPT